MTTVNKLANSVKIIILSAVLTAIAAIVVYFLWNLVMPDIFGVKDVNYWQTWGMLFMMRVTYKTASTTLPW